MNRLHTGLMSIESEQFPSLDIPRLHRNQALVCMAKSYSTAESISLEDKQRLWTGRLGGTIVKGM